MSLSPLPFSNLRGLERPADPLTDAIKYPSGVIAGRRPRKEKSQSGRQAFVLVGLGFGDEGKGTMVDALVRRQGAELVVRYNGGAQAAHNVVLDDGREHCFQMFGAGTLAGAKTYLSEYVLVNPLALAVEGAKLADLDQKIAEVGALSLVSVNRSAPLTTPFHVALNRIREIARDNRHGSCGMGIAETMRDVLSGQGLFFGDIGTSGFRQQLEGLQAQKYHQALEAVTGKNLNSQAREQFEQELFTLSSKTELENTLWVFEMVARTVTQVDSLPTAETYVFEGAQGVLLDESWGFTPHKTFSTTTSRNALKILEGRNMDITVWGILRAYSTRHGRGPLATIINEKSPLELQEKNLQGSLTTQMMTETLTQKMLAGEHNVMNSWQEDFRVGYPDMVAAKYASLADGNLDGLIVTCLDRIENQTMKIATSYKTATLTGLAENEDDDLKRTETLFNANPVYETVNSQDIPHRLASATNVPLVALSCGASTGDKEWL